MTAPLERIETLLMQLVAKNSELEKKVDQLSAQLGTKRVRKPKKHLSDSKLGAESSTLPPEDSDRPPLHLPLSSSETCSSDTDRKSLDGRSSSAQEDCISPRRPRTPKMLRDIGERTTFFPGAMGMGLDLMLSPANRRAEIDSDSSVDLDSNAKFELFASMMRKAVQKSPVLQSTAMGHGQDLLLVTRMLTYIPVVWADCFQSLTHTRNAFSFELVGQPSSSSAGGGGGGGSGGLISPSNSDHSSLSLSESTMGSYEQPSLQRVLTMIKNEEVNELRKLLIHGCCDSYELAEGNTFLHLAAHNRSLKLCSLLLGNDFSILKQNMQGEPALFAFLASDQHPYATDLESLFKLLLGFDTDWPNFRCKSGNTILHAAANGNSPALLSLCLAQGVSAHATNKVGSRPLDILIRYSGTKDSEMAQLLFAAEMEGLNTTLKSTPSSAAPSTSEISGGDGTAAREQSSEDIERVRRKAEVARLYQLLQLINMTAKDKPQLHEWVLGRLFQLLDLVYDERDNDSGLNRLSADIRQDMEAGVLRSVSGSAICLTDPPSSSSSTAAENENENENEGEAEDEGDRPLSPKGLSTSNSTEAANQSMSKVLHLRAVTLPRLIALVSSECQPLDLVFLSKVCATSTYVWGAQRPYIDLLAALLLEHLSAGQTAAYGNMCVLLYEHLLPMTVEQLTGEHASVLEEVSAQLRPRRSNAEARLARLIESASLCTDRERRRFPVSRLHMKNELPALHRAQQGALPSLLQLDTRSLAATLTMWAVSLLAPVSSRQLVAHVRSPPPAGTPVRQAIFAFNLVGRWVATTILTVAESSDERVRLILKFLGVATACLSWHDYHTALAINSGFNHAAIFRLKQTWKDPQLAGNADLERLTAIANPTANYSGYRAAIGSCPAGQPCIPYLPTLLSDLTFIHNGLPDFVGETARTPRLINFLKCKWFFAITECLWEKIASPAVYDFQLDPSSAAYLSAIDACESFTDESLQELSKKRRAEADPSMKLRRKHSSTFSASKTAGVGDSLSSLPGQSQQSGAVGLWDCVPDFAKQEALTPTRGEETALTKDKRKSNRFNSIGKQLKKSKKTLKNQEAAARVEGRGEITDAVAAIKSRRLLRQDSEESKKTDALLAGSQAQGFLDFVDDNDYCGESERLPRSHKDKTPKAKERLRDFLYNM